jgi:hypothetical protein
MRRMFSENQIGKIAKYVAQHDLSDVDLNVASINANGAVTAKTLSQSEANYDFDFSSLLKAEDETSFEIDGVPFAHFKVINGCLHIVCAVRFHNKTQETKSFRLGQIAIDLPENIASKIYNVFGHNASESGQAGFVRTAFVGYSDTNSSTIRLSNTSTANQVVLYQPLTRNILANEYIALSFEMTLTII